MRQLRVSTVQNETTRRSTRCRENLLVIILVLCKQSPVLYLGSFDWLVGRSPFRAVQQDRIASMGERLSQGGARASDARLVRKHIDLSRRQPFLLTRPQLCGELCNCIARAFWPSSAGILFSFFPKHIPVPLTISDLRTYVLSIVMTFVLYMWIKYGRPAMRRTRLCLCWMACDRGDVLTDCRCSHHGRLWHLCSRAFR